MKGDFMLTIKVYAYVHEDGEVTTSYTAITDEETAHLLDELEARYGVTAGGLVRVLLKELVQAGWELTGCRVVAKKGSQKSGETIVAAATRPDFTRWQRFEMQALKWGIPAGMIVFAAWLNWVVWTVLP